MMIYAGTINIKTDKTTTSTDINSLKAVTSCLNELNKLDLISRFQNTQIIKATCLSYDLLSYCFTIYIDNYKIVNDMEPFLNLMSHVNRTSSTTNAFESVFCNDNTDKNLLDIFVNLMSPHVDLGLSSWCDNQDILDFLLHDITHIDIIPGMKTRLYSYQKNSLWKILQRELAPRRIEGYEMIKLKGVNNEYYLNQLTGEISLTSEKITDAQGGIICEDMGTGKTCICLATVMATKNLSNLSHFNNELLQTEFPTNQTSLKAICAKWMMRLGINWKPIRHNLPMDVIEWFQQYPMYYEWTDRPLNYYERSHRIERNFTTLRVYLSNAALVVVPDNLVAQWTGEIYKHIQDGQLRFLVYDEGKQIILPALQLLDYDLVLISQTRFSQENNQGGFDFTSRPCQCPYIGSTRERACICAVTEIDVYTSPLLQVHWKRVIIDEGHRLSSKNRQSELSCKLFSNWKWICTGTPTQNLTESASMRTRQESESDDLNRLGTLFGQVLGIEPFKSNKKLWKKMVSRPFLEGKPWAVHQLTCIMDRVMVRNQRQDMEKEVTLPPLHQSIIYLDFDYYQWIAHNCQVAMISLNAILSRREGPDYLFSSKNFKSLRETVYNLWQSCLWHSIDLLQLAMAFDNCSEKCIELEQGTTDYGEDNQDLLRIREVLKHALDDKMFLAMMARHSPSYIVQGLPPLFREQWGQVNGDHGAYDLSVGHCIVNADQIMQVIDIISAAMKQDQDKNLFVYNGSDQTLLSVDAYHANKKKKKAELKKKQAEEVVEEEEQEEQLTFYNKNAFSDATILSSTSVKINYLVNQIVKYQATEKCIIFSQHYNEMNEIYLALQLAKVRVLMYQDSRMNNTKRSQMILTFNTSDNANVIIMAVQKAAYGIDLSSATRVFFISPVWQTAIEQQAIKRAHRIGQTKPVFIETLVIRNTIEDKLLKRRNQASQEMQGEEQEDKENLKRGDFFSDSKLRNILNHAYFVPLPETIEKVEQVYHQKIEPLNVPIYFVPQQKRLWTMEETLSSPDKGKRSISFAIDDIDIEEEENIEGEKALPSIPDQKPLLAHQQGITDTSSEEDIMLDIEGDEVELDQIPAWKLRLQDSSKKRKATESPESSSSTKKVKKSVKFA